MFEIKPSRPLLFLATLALATPVAAGAKECQVKVVRAITDDLGNHWTPGKVLPVDIARDGPGGGAFCAHGGSCLPRRVGGAKAVQLINCIIGPAIDASDRRLTPR